MCWVVPLPSSSHHQDSFKIVVDVVGDPHKPSFATNTGTGDNPKYVYIDIVLCVDLYFLARWWCGHSKLTNSSHASAPKSCWSNPLHALKNLKPMLHFLIFVSKTSHLFRFVSLTNRLVDPFFVVCRSSKLECGNAVPLEVRIKG